MNCCNNDQDLHICTDKSCPDSQALKTMDELKSHIVNRGHRCLRHGLFPPSPEARVARNGVQTLLICEQDDNVDESSTDLLSELRDQVCSCLKRHKA